MYIDNNSNFSTKLNRNAEIPDNCNTDDSLGDNEYALLKKLAEETDIPVDTIFPPIRNFHSPSYRSIDERWG